MAIDKRGKTWRARIDYYDQDGNRKVKSKSGFRTKKEAEIYLAELKTAQINGELSLNTETKFPRFFINWFKNYKENSVTARTKATYIQFYNVLEKSSLKELSIGKMDRLSYQKFINEYGQTHAKSTVVKLNSLVRSCVKDAMYDGFVKKDFTHGVSLSFDEKRTRNIEYLNVNETKALLEFVKNTANPHFTAKYMIILAINTGMRLGEIQGLMWKNINFDFNTITIDHSWNYEENAKQSTKANSDRILHVNAGTMDYLKILKEHSTSEMVFINQYKTLPSSSAVNKTLRESLKACGIVKRGFHFHSLRHTHVAYLLSEGVDLYIISKRLGHSDVTMTSRVYSYLIDEYRQVSNLKIISSLDKLDNADLTYKEQVK